MAFAWYDRALKLLENPPLEIESPTMLDPVVVVIPPTAVTYGEEAGKFGTK
jgi:hypothetical protein